MRVLWFLSVLALVGAGIYVWMNPYNIDIKFPRIGSFNTEMTDGLTQTATNVTSRIVTTVAEKTSEIVSNAIDAIKQKSFETFERMVGDAVQETGKRIGVVKDSSSEQNAFVVNQSDATVNQPISFAVPAGTKAYFSIKNDFSTPTTYKVVWKDSSEEEGTIAANQSITVHHAWQKAGNYMVEFIVTNNQNTKSYKVLISIFL